MQSFTTKEGLYFQFDTATNEFGIINKHGSISTYYIPDTGILDQVKNLHHNDKK